MMELENFIIIENSNIRDALRKIDINKNKFIIVVNNNYIVLGVITDGDIRRALLNGFSLNSSISNFFNRDFKFLTLDTTFSEVSNVFKDSKIDFLPILDSNGKLVNVLTKKQFHIFLLEGKEFDLFYPFYKLNNIKLDHEIYSRPWGFYKSTLLTPFYQVKLITVFPNSELSLQEHKRREEHWVIVKGRGKVVVGESKIDVYPGKYIYIPKGCKHQIINNSKSNNLVFSEVQLGDYFGEDDIIRYSDKYGRTNWKENK